MDGLMALVILSVLVIMAALAYKNRHSIASWLNDTTLTQTDEKKKRYLKYHIEDCQAEIDEIEKRLNKDVKTEVPK